MPNIALVKCENYDYNKVKDSINRGINLLGGINRFVKKGEKILLKPNLLGSAPPEKCVTTHPSVFKAIAEILINSGINVSYGDSPGFQSSRMVAKKAGIEEVALELNLDLADFKNGIEVFYKEGKQNKKFVIANGIFESNGIISLPKIKTHGFQKLTCCIKNQFGCIPGLLKGEFHVKLSNANDFAKMLVDLDSFIKPRLYIVDGIFAMEGNGPSGGKPKKMNVLLFGDDPVAIDATICRLIYINPEFVPTIKYGKEFGRGVYEENKIRLLGDNIDDFEQKDFDIDKSKIRTTNPGGFFYFISNILIPRPVIDNTKCVKCGVCVEICPVNPKALNWDNNNRSKPPVYDYKKCIRCYCCQELCPHSAINVKKPLLRRLLLK